MQKLYTASFNLGSLEGAGPSLAEVAEACRPGLARHPLVDARALAAVRSLTAPGRSELGDQAWCDAYSATIDGFEHWALCLEFIDPDDSISRWRTTFCARRDPDDQTAFSCTVSVGAVSHSAVPVDIAPRRPQPIVDLLRCWGGFKGAWSVSILPRRITAGDAAGLVNAIESFGRYLPLVHVDVAPATGRPAVDAAPIADELAGIAHVSVATDAAAAAALASLLPHDPDRRVGAVRVYWPQPYLTRPGLGAQFPTAGQVEGTVSRRLLKYIVGKTLHVDDPESPDVSILELEAKLSSDAGIDRGSEDRELAQLFALENDELQRAKKDLSRQVTELEQDLATMRRDVRSWRGEVDRLVRVVGPRAYPIQADPLTVSEAVEMARVRYGDELVFATNSRSQEANCPYHQPVEVLRALEFLATTYRNARRGIAKCQSFDRELRSTIGWSYKGGQSPVTIGNYMDWYVTTWDRRRFKLEEHLRKGVSKDPRWTISIAFAWDQQTDKVVIGYIGQHQRTTRT